jgi:hypothetical protein
MQGLCTGHNNPDLWFSDVLETEGGRAKLSYIKEMIENTQQAVAICNTCPVKQACFDEGMKPENIDHGIWGGSLSGERILISKVTITELRKPNVKFAKQFRELNII